jgi:hypothetical protein
MIGSCLLNTVYRPFAPFTDWASLEPTPKRWQSFTRLLAVTQRSTGQHPITTPPLVARAAALERAGRLILGGEIEPGDSNSCGFGA